MHALKTTAVVEATAFFNFRLRFIRHPPDLILLYLMFSFVTVQYLHSYEQKSNKNRLRRWDFCVQLSGFWHIHAKTPRGIVAPE